MAKQTTKITKPPTGRLSSWWRLRRVRWATYLLLVALLYKGLIWSLLWMVDESQIARDLDEWAENELNTEMAITGAELDMDFRGRTTLTFDELAITPPNEALFDGRFVQGGPVTVTLPVSGFFGATCQPRLRLEDLDILVEWDGEGFDNSSLSGLCDPLDEPAKELLFPLVDLKPERTEIRIRKSRLRLARRHRNETIEIRLRSNMIYDTTTRHLSGWFKRGHVIDRFGVADERQSAIEIEQFDLGPAPSEAILPVALHTCAASLTDVPVHLFNLVWPGTVPEERDIRLNGKLVYADNAVRLTGAVSGYHPEELVRPSLVVNVTRKADGTWQPLRAKCEVLDLDRLSAPRGHKKLVWLEHIIRVFRAIRLEAKTIHLLGSPLHDAHLKIGAIKDAEGGDLAMRIYGKQFGRTGPGSGPVMPLGIPAIRWHPSAGEVEVLFARNRLAKEGTDAATPAWSAAVELKNLSIPTRSSGSLFRSLAHIPVILNDLMLLRSKVVKEPVDRDAKPLALGSLIFNSLILRYDLYRDGQTQLIVGGTSPDLGAVTGAGTHHPDGTFSIGLSFRNIPDALFERNPALSEDMLTAIRQYAATATGLQVKCTVTKTGEKIEPLYVQSIFKHWVENRAKQEEETRAAPQE